MVGSAPHRARGRLAGGPGTTAVYWLWWVDYDFHDRTASVAPISHGQPTSDAIRPLVHALDAHAVDPLRLQPAPVVRHGDARPGRIDLHGEPQVLRPGVLADVRHRLLHDPEQLHLGGDREAVGGLV